MHNLLPQEKHSSNAASLLRIPKNQKYNPKNSTSENWCSVLLQFKPPTPFRDKKL
jgi:hypothetical protein